MSRVSHAGITRLPRVNHTNNVRRTVQVAIFGHKHWTSGDPISPGAGLYFCVCPYFVVSIEALRYADVCSNEACQLSEVVLEFVLNRSRPECEARRMNKNK
jgi:hypothetical protein